MLMDRVLHTSTVKGPIQQNTFFLIQQAQMHLIQWDYRMTATN